MLFVHENFEKIMRSHDYLSFFTTFRERKMTSVWIGKAYKQIEDEPEYFGEYFGAEHIKTPNIHPVPGRDSSPCVDTGSGLWN